MKKAMSLLLVIIILLSLSACGGNGSATNNDTGSSTTQNQADVSDTSSTEQNTDTPSSTADNNGSSSDTDVPSSTTNTPNTTTHTHSYSSATCTTPAKCSCGATNDSALGHSYGNADCTNPKKCSRCGTTEGNALGHNYSNGVCSRCGTTEVLDSGSGLTKPDSIHDWFDDQVNERVYVTETTYVYLAPGTEYEVIGTLNKGDVVTRTSIGSLVGWNRIEYNGERAYVKSSCLSTKDPFFIAAEAYGFNVGNIVTTTDSKGSSYTLKYLGEDRWEDQNGNIWTSYERDDGSLHFTSFSSG